MLTLFESRGKHISLFEGKLIPESLWKRISHLGNSRLLREMQKQATLCRMLTALHTVENQIIKFKFHFANINAKAYLLEFLFRTLIPNKQSLIEIFVFHYCTTVSVLLSCKHRLRGRSGDFVGGCNILPNCFSSFLFPYRLLLGLHHVVLLPWSVKGTFFITFF